MKQNDSSSIKSWISVKQLVIPVIAAFFVAVTVYATTTIGNNISTDGTLDVTGVSTFSRATSTSATSTAYMYIGFDVTEPTGWDFSGGDLAISGDAYFNNKATSSVALMVGGLTSVPNWLNLAGGDLYVQDDAQIGDALIVGGTASSTALVVGGTATTTKLIVGERQAANATTTIVLGDLVAESAPCIKLRTTSGAWVFAYPTSSASMTSVLPDGTTFGLNWTTDSCE